MVGFSVIIAAYQAETTLQDALESVANQSVADWECIIIDDGSTDRTASIAEHWCSLDTRFILIRSASNEGPSAARNLGLDAAQGEWISILDADDCYETNRLYKLRKAAEKLDVDVIFDNQWLWTPAGRVRKRWLELGDDDLRQHGLDRFLYQVSGFSARHWGAAKPMFRRQPFESKKICYDIRFTFGEDVLFFVQLINITGSFGVCGYPGYVYRLPSVHGGNLSLIVTDQGQLIAKELLVTLGRELTLSGRICLHLRFMHFELIEWQTRLREAIQYKNYTASFLMVITKPKAWLWLALRGARKIGWRI